MDHNLLSILTAGVLVVLSIIGIMLRGWFKHVNDNLEAVWKEFKEERKAREDRWNILHQQCSEHAAKLANLEGRLNGKAK